MVVRVRHIIGIMEKIAPETIAEGWDNPGLHIGTPEKEVKKILTALDPVETVIEEAIDKGADLIITHHPFFLETVKTLREDRPSGRMAARLIKNDIALYCAHTNLDNARGGINDYLATLLGMTYVEALRPLEGKGYSKIAVFVPAGHEQGVISAMAEAGAGWIGNYSHCTFRGEGTGTFMPRENTNPYLGEKDSIKQAREYRIETIVPSEQTRHVIRAIRAVHPYEEMAYDIYDLKNKRRDIGPGRIGMLNETLSLKDFAERVKKRLKLEYVMCSGDSGRIVKKVALCGGSGGSLIEAAAAAGADVFLTGDVKHHDAHNAKRLGMGLIDAGHYGTEKFAPDIIKTHIEKYLKETGRIVQVIKSGIDTEALRIL